MKLGESATTEAGGEFTPPFETPFGALGMQICFDLRFPEAARWLVNRGAQVLSYPSAFTVPTGRAHWELLLRARAVEGQCWVVAAAQGGWHNSRRASWGQACVVDPWGAVVAQCLGGEEAGEEEVCFADVDLAMVERVRSEVPLRRRVWVSILRLGVGKIAKWDLGMYIRRYKNDRDFTRVFRGLEALGLGSDVWLLDS